MPKKKITKKVKQPLLIIEDEPIIAMMYVRAFAASPYEVIIAKTFEQGVLMFEERLPLIILLDLLIPQKDQIEPDYAGEPVGFTLLKMIRKNPNGKGSKVIVVTNLAEDSHRQRALDLGADEYYIKAQLDPHDLVKKVDAIAK